MFGRIAHRYDLMNALMTGGRHQAWRRVAACLACAESGLLALDVATGTADLALALVETGRARAVVGLDFVEPMLGLAQAKLARRAAGTRVRLVAGDALALPFPEGTFGCVASAFLLRNLADLRAGLAEMRRVTAPGGRVVALEIAQPTLPGFRALFRAYFHRFVPWLGRLISGDRDAYTYLPRSVEDFLPPEGLAALMREVGLREVGVRRLGLGTVTIHVGTA